MHRWHQSTQLFFSVSIPSPCLSPWSDHHCLLMHIISLCPRPNSSALEIRCPWSLALPCVMPYWAAIARYDRAKSVLQEYVFGCNNLEQSKKHPQEKNHNSAVSVSAQGGERQAPVMIILWDSVVFGTQTLLWSVFQESLSMMRKEFPI